MSSTAIIIPTRLKAKRLPNKPLELIRNKEMILHVYDVAVKSGAGDVLVVTPDQKIFDLLKNYGAKCMISKNNHETGTDRVFEAFKNFFSCQPENIINLQGDMPNLNPKDIVSIKKYFEYKKCDICTLGSELNKKERIDKNIVKVLTKKSIKNSDFTEVSDFKRQVTDEENSLIYHHIGIYGFTNQALMRYVNFKRSKLEIERNLEQMRAMENNLKIHVGYSNSKPLSVDTKEDLLEIKKIMEINEKI